MKKILILILTIATLNSCTVRLDEKTMVVSYIETSETYDLARYTVCALNDRKEYNGHRIIFTAPSNLYKLGDTLTFTLKTKNKNYLPN